MLDPFDIFKLEENGSVSWTRAISDFERAKSYVIEVLVITTPADYLILNQRTGERTIIKVAPEQRDQCSAILAPSACSRA
jgi:hypothetical protein